MPENQLPNIPAATDSSRFRFGIMLNSTLVEQWQARAIELLLQEGHLAVVLVLPNNETQQLPFWKRLSRYPWRRLLFRIWHRYYFKPEAKKPFDLRAFCTDADCLYLDVTSRKGANYIADNQVVELENYQLDFILRFGFNILRGSVLQAARYGIWSFHHDDERVIRGGPPGFWEVYHGMLTNGIILQQLTNELDKGLIISRYNLNVVRHSYKEHLNRLYFESAQMPAQHCRKLHAQPYFKPEASTSKAEIFHPPSNLKMLAFWIKMLYRRVTFHLNDLFRQEDWHIGFVPVSLQNFALDAEKHLAGLQWVSRKSKTAYLADPFVFESQHGTQVLAEYFDYRNGKGTIVMLQPHTSHPEYHTVLQGQNHFSFPGLFQWEGVTYCLPESFESGKISLFRWEEDAGKFLNEIVLLENVAAVDPVLFRHGQFWWLLFTERRLPSVHLYAYYADHPFGTFQPHTLNPVKSDISTSRNAGYPLIINDMTIRPAQDCSGHYGRAVNLQRIERLDPHHFEETHWKRIEPLQDSPYSFGLHSINGNKNMTVVDAKRYSFSWAGFCHQLKLKTTKR